MNQALQKLNSTGFFAIIFIRMSRVTAQRGNKMIALRQIKRVPKNHKIVIEVPDTILENQIMEVILLCRELPENDKANKIAQLIDSQHDPLFLNDVQVVSDDFISVDNEAW